MLYLWIVNKKFVSSRVEISWRLPFTAFTIITSCSDINFIFLWHKTSCHVGNMLLLFLVYWRSYQAIVIAWSQFLVQFACGLDTRTVSTVLPWLNNNTCHTWPRPLAVVYRVCTRMQWTENSYTLPSRYNEMDLTYFEWVQVL